VDEVFGPRAFTVDEDDPLAGGIDNDLLVLGDATALPQELDDQWMNDSVRITGEVALLTADEIQTRLGWEPSQELRAELEGRRAVLIARTVDRDETTRPAE
jgi:hypothetical protein